MKGFINRGVIFRSFGISITVVGFFMLTALPFAFYYGEDTVWPLLLSSAVSLAMGQFFTIINKRSKTSDISERDAYLIVTLTWFMVGFFGALPFVFSGAIPNFTNAYFEAISGFTTTGATILKDLEVLPKSILYWRSLMQWLGGMGILVLVIAILPSLGFGGMKLFLAESPGPTTTKIHPKIRQMALRLWVVYTVITLVLVGLLLLGGMNLFESICHSLSTLATGGFSPKNTSIADYSPYIQIVITIFMFIGAVNFAVHYYMLKGKFRKALANEELWMFFLFVCIVAVSVSILLHLAHDYTTYAESLRHAFFQTISLVSTTGFATADYMLWPQATWMWLLLLFFVGGMIGSTAGGIKFTRVFILLKNIRSETKRIIHPRAIISIRLNKKSIPDDVVRNFLIVFIAFIVVFCLGSLAMSLFMTDAKEAIGATIACLGNVGPAFRSLGPAGNYSEVHDAAKWILSIIMVAGRLEVFPFLIFFHYTFWKK